MTNREEESTPDRILDACDALVERRSAGELSESDRTISMMLLLLDSLERTSEKRGVRHDALDDALDKIERWTRDRSIAPVDFQAMMESALAALPPSETAEAAVTLQARLLAARAHLARENRDGTIGWVAQRIRQLHADTKEPIAELEDEGVRLEVARHVTTSLERLAPHLLSEADAELHLGSRDGMFSWDAALADELENIGAVGAKTAKQLRTNARKREAKREAGTLDPAERFHAWFRSDTRLQAVITLARVVWLDVVRPQIKRREAKPPALAYPIHVSVVDVLTRTTKTEDGNGQRSITFPGVPLIDAAALTAVQTRGVELLRSRTAFRFVGWAVMLGHERAIHDVPDPRTLHVVGGWGAIADELGMTSKRAPEEIRAIAEALDIARVPLPTGEHRTLLMLRDAEAATGQRQSSIKIILGPELLPDYVFDLRHAMPKGRMLTEAERLIPMLRDVPVTGAKQTYGAQEALAMLFVRELRVNARSLARTGAVEISRRRWGELASQVRLPNATLPKVLDRWERDGDDAPALFVRKGDGFTLSNAHAPARTFIVDAGRNSENQAKRAQTDQAARGKRRPARRPKSDAGK